MPVQAGVVVTENVSMMIGKEGTRHVRVSATL